VISLEEAIRKMTSANAVKLSLWDRGMLRPGLAADVTIFNAETIIDHATYEKPHQYAEGVEFLIVNGKLVLERGRHTNARPGVILYGQGHAR
jgi:N-acyl-D-amino-acid deacylase